MSVPPKKYMLAGVAVLLCLAVLLAADAVRNRRLALEAYLQSHLGAAAEHVLQDYENRGGHLLRQARFLRGQSAAVSLATIPGLDFDVIESYCETLAATSELPLVALVDDGGNVLGSYGADAVDFKWLPWAEWKAAGQDGGTRAAGSEPAMLLAGVPLDSAAGFWLVLGDTLPLSQWDAWVRNRSAQLILSGAHQQQFLHAKDTLQWVDVQGTRYAAVGRRTKDRSLSVAVLQQAAEAQQRLPWVNRYLLAAFFLGLCALAGYYVSAHRRKPEKPVADNSTREMVRALMAVPIPAEEALQALEEGLVRTDAKMNILWANRAFAAMAGAEPQELIGRSMISFCPLCESLVAAWSESTMRFLSSEPKRTELIADGKTESVHMRTVLKRESFESNPSFYFIFTSLQSRQRAEKLESENSMLRSQLQALKDQQQAARQQTPANSVGRPSGAVEQWLRAAVHSVKNPLGVLLMGLDYLEPALKSGKESYADILQLMREAAAEADQVTHGLLQFAALEHYERAPQAIGELVQAARERVDAAARQRGVSLRVTVEPALPALSVDKSLITEALQVLFEQSLMRSAPGSEINVNVGLETLVDKGQGVGRRSRDAVAQGDRVVAITLSDRGPAIDEQALERLLKPFVTQPGSGGAGLALAAGIAELHRGTLQVKSGSDDVTRFRLLLPAGARRSAGQARLLLIDDDRGLCKLLKLNLEKDGAFQVETAYTGESGLALAAKEVFDVVLTDFQLPDIDGKAVLKRLKDADARLPVVLFSIFHDHERLRRDPDLALADAFLEKPIDHARLRETLYRFVK